MLTSKWMILIHLFDISISAKRTVMRPHDLSGWQNFQWGMSIEDVQRAFVPSKPGLTLMSTPMEPHILCAFYDIGSSTCTLTVIFEESSHLLKEVRLTFLPSNGLAVGEQEIVNFCNMYISKYGNAYKGGYTAMDEVVMKWIFNTTTIELCFDRKCASVSYVPTDSSITSNLDLI